MTDNEKIQEEFEQWWAKSGENRKALEMFEKWWFESRYWLPGLSKRTIAKESFVEGYLFGQREFALKYLVEEAEKDGWYGTDT